MSNQQLDLFPKPEEPAQKIEITAPKTNMLSTYRALYANISWQELVGKLITALRVPLIAAKYQLLTRAKIFLSTRPFPWFKVALVCLFLYVFFTKNLQFNINTGATSSLDEQSKLKTSELAMNGFSQQANFPDKPVVATVQLANQDVKAYINRFTKVALIEMQKFDIPASVKMGQAILASHAGKNGLALRLNNHFATTCTDGANCQEYQIGKQSALVKSYQSAWESWRAHSQLLSTSTYMHLKEYGRNYKKWAKGLEQAGYGTANNYSQQLINCIETYQLYKLDELTENL